VSLAPSLDSEIKIIKAKRGNKKFICSVIGLHHYGVNLKDAAKLMSKKFACSASVADDDKYGECI
jgi:translation initiation factor 1 (eIF-1/SUI1)